MYRAILVPVDGSPFGETALALAVALAERTRASLHIVHVLDVDADARAMRAYLDETRARLTLRVSGELVTEVLMGDIGEAIAAYVSSHKIDVVALATHGRGGVSRAWLGSVAEELISTLPVPVLLQRPTAAPSDGLLQPTLPSKVFVPIERSEASAAILPHAELLARESNAEVVLATVIAPIEVRAATVARVAIPLDDEMIATRQASAMRFLAEVAEPLRERGLHVHTTVLMHHHAATAILQGAERAGAQVIAMTTHARRGVTRALLGSTTDKVVRGTSKTMLLNRPG